MPELFLFILFWVYVIGMIMILAYSLAQGHLLYQFLKNSTKETSLPKAPEEWPSVTLQLPIFNERYVVDRLLDAVAAMDYPRELLEIQILDDSTDETQELIKKKMEEYPEIPFVYLHRKKRKGFKAGALREGLKVATGELIAIFDADFLPAPDFLKKTIAYFSDEKVGMVQSRWTHLNADYSLLTRLQGFALDAHFIIEQFGRNRLGAFINFNGTGGIWRKNCILESGNWEDDTLTEDLDLSYRAQKLGWKFVYNPEIQSPAELPPIMSAIKSQQFRWNKGGAECAKKHIKSVWFSKLSLPVKLHATAHLFNSSIFLVVLVVSLASIGVWVMAWKNILSEEWLRFSGFFLVGFVLIAGVYLIAHLYTSRPTTWKSFWTALWLLPLFLAVSMGLAVHNSRAVWEGWTGKRSDFIRTPKFNLESGNGSLDSNSYRKKSMPWSTWAEGGMSLLFWGMTGVGFWLGEFLFLPFHILLGFGYGVVFLSSLRSYGLKEEKAYTPPQGT